MLVGDVTSDRRSDAGDPFLPVGDRHDAMLPAVGWNYPHWVLTKVDGFGGFFFFLVALLFFAAGAVGGGGIAVDASHMTWPSSSSSSSSREAEEEAG